MMMAAPQLVFFHGSESENQVLSDSSGRRIGELVNRRILRATNLADWFILQVTDPHPNSLSTRISTMLSSFSLIIARRIRIRVCLWNPVTLQSIDLPVLEIESVDCIIRVLVTANPNNPKFWVVLILENKYILSCHVNNSGEDDDDHRCWTRMDYPDNFCAVNGGFQMSEFAVMFDRNTIVVRTRFRSNYAVASIQIEKPKGLVMRPRKMKIPCRRAIPAMGTNKLACRNHCVSGCGNKLFLIGVNFGGVRGWDEVVSIVVYQLNYNMSWNILGTCPNAAFFINGDDQGIWCPMSKAEAGNRVYMVHKNGARYFLYTYHIENKTLSRSLLSSRPYWMPIASVAPSLEEEKADENDQEKYYNYANGETNEVNDGEDVSLLGIMLNDLPADLLKSIFSHLLNPVDYLNIRATNKLCWSVGSANEWRSILSTSEGISMCPWLMIPSVVDSGVSGMVDPVSGKKYYQNTCWGYDFSRVCYSSNGWLLMLADFLPGGLRGPRRPRRVKLWLYNPITKHTLHFPEHDYLDLFMITCSTDPHNCRVVGMSTIQSNFYFIELDRNQSYREYEWNRGEIGGVQPIHVNQSNINPACVQDKYYYFLVGDGDLASFVYDNVENRFHLTVHRLKLPCTDFFEQRFVVAGYDNIILAIYVGKEGESLRVFEFDGSKVVMEWVEVHDLRNHNVYLSAVTCICKQAEFPGKGNRIYLPRFHGGHIVHYSLDTCEFHAGEDVSSVVSYYGSEEQLYSCWFEPSLALKSKSWPCGGGANFCKELEILP